MIDRYQLLALYGPSYYNLGSRDLVKIEGMERLPDSLEEHNGDVDIIDRFQHPACTHK